MPKRTSEEVPTESPFDRAERLAPDKGAEIEELLRNPSANEGPLYLRARVIADVERAYQDYVSVSSNDTAGFAEAYLIERSHKLGGKVRQESITDHRGGLASRQDRAKAYDYAEGKGASIGGNRAVGELAVWLWAQENDNAERIADAVGLSEQSAA